MPWMYKCVFLALLCLVRVDFSFGQWDTNSNTVGDLKPLNNEEDNSALAGSGNGRTMEMDTDDEDLLEEESGSGSGYSPIEIDNKNDIIIDGEVTTTRKTQPSSSTTTTSTTTRATTLHPKSECEKTRDTNQHLAGQFVPDCLPNGDYASMQCQAKPGLGECWCSDLHGIEVPGTMTEAPEFPDCEGGSNLSPCHYKLVKSIRNSRLLGVYRPQCAVDGTFERKQCHENICFCVDESDGHKKDGTEVHVPDKPNCDDDSDMVVDIGRNNKEPDNKEDGIVIDEPEVVKVEVGLEAGTKDSDGSMDIDENIEGKLDIDNDGEQDKEVDETNETDHQDQEMSKKKHIFEEASEIMTQPGILAGIIGGSVVLLLCLVLLVMFIVYRMRKKDEGSYPLDEPTKRTPNYSYVRAPEREFYA